MREYTFDPEGELPVVRATLEGPNGQKRVTLVLDTGCAITQVHHQILALIGCGEDRCLKKITIGGVTGEGDPAYVVALESLKLLGNSFDGARIAGVDFSKWARSGIEGLIGWDIVKTFDLELLGSAGVLKVY